MTLFYVNRNNCHGIVEYKHSVYRFIVKSGSKIAKDVPEVYKRVCQYAYKKRLDIINKKQCDVDGDFLVIHIDITFKSPSGASKFILGRTSSGSRDLKDENGHVFKILRIDNENEFINRIESEELTEKVEANTIAIQKMQEQINNITKMLKTITEHQSKINKITDESKWITT